MSATIRDVAQQAGVGLGTVSRVINGSPSVSDATRQRVLDVIKHLNYVPNPTARRLSLGRTLTIGVIVPFFTRPAEVERLRGIEHTLLDSGYDLILYNVETPEQRDQYFRDIPRRERVDGVLIVSLTPRDGDVKPFKKANVPIVLVDAHHASLAGLNQVVTDDVTGGRAATQHLIELGHRRIAYLSDCLDEPFNFTSSRDRLTGYQQALQAAGIPFRADYHVEGDHGRTEARRVAAQLLALPDHPTAIFAASDTQAMGVLEAARDAGLRVPEDLSVIGYDDIEIAEYLGLTTMSQKLYQSGQRGVELLLAVLENPDALPVTEVMTAQLTVRRTTARVAMG
jgi:DNA-binding LacI/PurR family transcriptional regulator